MADATREFLQGRDARVFLHQVADIVKPLNPARWNQRQRIIAASVFLLTLGVALPLGEPATNAAEAIYSNIVAAMVVILTLAALLGTSGKE
jgi:hypothetical protein